MNKSIIYKNITLVFLWIMSIQYLPLEGDGVSYFKFSLICTSPVIWFLNFKSFSKGFLLGSLFISSIIFSSLYNEQEIRFTSLVYKISFIVMFIMYYDLIYLKHALTLKMFKNFIKNLIYAYSICLLIQQVFIIFGVTEFPLINLVTFLDRGLGANSLSLEPSHSARILTASMLVLLRLEKVSSDKNYFELKTFYQNNKKLIILFLWTMLTMGSGTAIVGIVILSIFFIKKHYILRLLSVLILILIIIQQIEYTPLDRVKNIILALETLDVNYIKSTDYSAASRLVPLINTINYIDLSDWSVWIGNGIDTTINEDYLGEEQYIGVIKDYGFITYISSLLLFFRCCTFNIFSIESLVFITLLATSITNVAYVWAILLLFTTSNYFTIKYKS